MDYERALIYATEKHRGQYRKGGAAYITHPKRVVELLEEKGVKDEEILIAGLFHDLLEDTDAKEEEIVFYGSKQVLKIVKLLTKEKNYNMDSYIENIQGDEDARLVKLADRIANLEDSLILGKDYLEFLESYILETKTYFIDLSEASIFQADLKNVVARVNRHIEKLKS